MCRDAWTIARSLQHILNVRNAWNIPGSWNILDLGITICMFFSIAFSILLGSGSPILKHGRLKFQPNPQEAFDRAACYSLALNARVLWAKQRLQNHWGRNRTHESTEKKQPGARMHRDIGWKTKSHKPVEKEPGARMHRDKTTWRTNAPIH